DPMDIDREVQKNIAEAIVESTMAASHIRSEARERVKQLIDAVAVEVGKLTAIVKQSKTSIQATNELPNALAAWEGEFATRVGTLLQQLQLPWTVQVSQLAKVLSHMAEGETAEEPPRPRAKDAKNPSIKRKQTQSEESEADLNAS